MAELAKKYCVCLQERRVIRKEKDFRFNYKIMILGFMFDKGFRFNKESKVEGPN